MFHYLGFNSSIISIIVQPIMEINTLTKIIRKKTGMNIHDFCKEKLGLNYNMYRYRVLNDRLHLNDYHVIMLFTGMTFEKLFPSPYVAAQPKKIPLNLSKKHVTTTMSESPLAKPQKSAAIARPMKDEPLPKRSEETPQEEEPVNSSSESFTFINPYPGGLPEVD